MTDTLHALFHRTWLLRCDVCGDQLRLAEPIARICASPEWFAWQVVINDWKHEHGDGHGNACHFYIDTVPSTMAGPPAVHHSDALVMPCIDRVDGIDLDDLPPLPDWPDEPDERTNR